MFLVKSQVTKIITQLFFCPLFGAALKNGMPTYVGVPFFKIPCISFHFIPGEKRDKKFKNVLKPLAMAQDQGHARPHLVQVLTPAKPSSPIVSMTFPIGIFW
jgi:hypothetical protein